MWHGRLGPWEGGWVLGMGAGIPDSGAARLHGGGSVAREVVTVNRKSYPTGVLRSAHPHPSEAGGNLILLDLGIAIFVGRPALVLEPHMRSVR